jgi:hypothetical protein
VQPEKLLDETVTGLAVVLRQSAACAKGAFSFPLADTRHGSPGSVLSQSAFLNDMYE